MADQKMYSHRCYSGCTTEEYKVLNSHIADISNAIQNPTDLSKELLQAELIGFSVHKDVCSPGLEHSYQVNKLLQCVQSQIEISTDNFYLFIEVLEKDPTLSGLCKQLKLKCSKELSQLLKKHNMTIEDIEKECSDVDSLFIEIAMKIDDYEEVGHHLNVSEQKLKSIREKPSDSDRKLAILWAWKRKLGSDANYLALVRAFLAMEDRLVAESILKHAKDVLAVPLVKKPSQIFPEKCYPNWDKMSESDKEKMKNDLIEENEHVRIAFASLVHKLRDSFASRNVNPIDVLAIAINYGIPEGSNCNENSDMRAVFLMLSKHSSWFNHQLFTVTIDVIGNPIEKKMLQQWQEETFLPYLKHCIFEIPSQSFSPCSSQSHSISLFLKVIENILLTGIDVETVQRKLAKLLGLSLYNLHFQSYQEGCFELFFIVNTPSFDPSECVHLEWQSSREAYKITVDLTTFFKVQAAATSNSFLLSNQASCNLVNDQTPLSIQPNKSSGEPFPSIEDNDDQLLHDDYFIESSPLTQDDYVHISSECTIDFDFQGGLSPKKFHNGLCVWNQSRECKYIDIAEAPFQLARSERLKPLEGNFAISFNEKPSIQHIRCHFLTHEDQGKLKSFLEKFEGIKSTIAILLINPSSDLDLQPEFKISDSKFFINIPVYVTSSKNGETIASLADTMDSCEGQLIFRQAIVTSEDGHDQDIQRNSDKTVSHRNHLLEHLQTYLFPDGKNPVTVSENPGAFMIITSAFVKKDLLTEQNLNEAVNRLSDYLQKIYRKDFIFLIHLVCLLLDAENHYFKPKIVRTKSNTKGSLVISAFSKKFINYMVNLEIEDIISTVNDFCKRGNFEVMDYNSSVFPVYHKIHNGILRLMKDYTNDLKHEDTHEDSLCKHLTILMIWITVALKFTDCSTSSYFTKPLDVWNDNVIKLLTPVTLTSKILASLALIFPYGDDIELEYRQTFIGCGGLQLLIQKNGNPRTFPELSYIVVHMHKWIKTADEFYDHFCQQTLAIHAKAFNVETAKHKKKTANISSVVGKNVVVEGFQYLDCVFECSKRFYDEKIEEGLQHWMTFLLQFLELSDEQNINIIKELKASSKYLLSEENLLSHYMKQIQQKGKENLLNFSLKHFVELSCQDLWNTVVVIDFFKNYGTKIPISEQYLDDLHVKALEHFSNRFRGASAHKFLIDHLLKPLSECYVKRNESTKFILDLVQVDVDCLLITRENNEDDFKVVDDFKAFLKTYVSQHDIEIILPNHFQIINMQLKRVTWFKNIVIDVIAEKLLAGSMTGQKWLNMLTTMTQSLCDTMKEGNKHSLCFYWKFFGGICKRIKISAESTIAEIYQYHDILCRVSPLYCELKERDAPTKDDANFLQVTAYMSMADALMQVLRNFKTQILSNEVNSDELNTYLVMHDIILKVAGNFEINSEIVPKLEVENRKTIFLKHQEFLTELLIQSLKNNSDWYSRHDILLTYNIEFPENISKGIRDSVYFPNSKPDGATVQQLSCHSPCLQVKANVTLRNLNKLVCDIKEFLGTLLDMMPMLDHFHLNGSDIFKAIIKSELSGDESVTPQQLAEILKRVKSKLINILTGDVTFLDIEPIADATKNFKYVKKEIEIMTNFPDFMKLGSTDAVVYFENMINLHHILEHIDSLFVFCEDFGLQECLKSWEMIRLRKIVDEHTNEKSRKEKILKNITEILTEIQNIFDIQSTLEDISEKFQFLSLFEPLNTHTKELRRFLNENNFRGKGQVQFEQLLALVTQQLQHEEYNAEILTKLYAVFYVLAPLNNPDISFHKVVETVSRLEISTCLSQLRAVNNNIDLITMWFSRAEGDTVANTANELHSIIANGTFHIRVSSLVEINEERIILKFQPESSSYQMSGHEASVSLTCLPKEEVYFVWNMTEIEDFVRRLGFAEAGEENTSMMTTFMELFEIMSTVQGVMESLNKMGHPNYSKTIFPYQIKCSDGISKLQELVKRVEKDKTEWFDKASNDRENFKWLSFLTTESVLELYKLMHSVDLSKKTLNSQKISTQLRFLIPVHHRDSVMTNFEEPEMLSNSVGPIEAPTEVVGLFLDKLFRSLELQLPTPPPHSSAFCSHAVLHQCHKFSPKQLIVYLVSINDQIPKPYEILRCHSGTTESDVKLFFQRIGFFCRHYYFVEINKLPSKLQENLLQQYMGIFEKILKSGNCSTIHFIETSSSLLYDAPCINTTTLQLKKDAERTLKNIFFSVVELVYGLQGDGKTHYINNQLGQSNIILAINEAFSVGRILSKLNSLNDNVDCSILFNFTVLPPGDIVADEERKQFTQLMDKIGWFMFDLFILGYVQDSHTGMTFAVPEGLNWKAYIEVPSISDSPQENLSTFRKLIPTFCFIGTERHIDSSIPYVVDDDVQLVCKYLRALNEEKRKPGRGIDRLYKKGGAPVKIGKEDNIDNSECLTLLNEYMCDYIKERKICQKLFIKYMKRRCQFLDSFPGYNYNQGIGPNGENTKKLGSTLMQVMLKEVEQFCDPSTKEDWSLRAHQQLIYEQYGGLGSITLITLCPDKMQHSEDKEENSVNIFNALELLGLNIPEMEKLYERSTLDEYLAKALSLPLSEVTEVVQVGTDKMGKPIKERQYKRLKIIDDNNYVLTLDYTLKMINIHERRECGMPVIIEGETGVGKTELLKMLSKLWNYSWEVQWSKQKEELQTLLVDIQKRREMTSESTLEQQLAALDTSINSSVEEDLVAGHCSDREAIVETLIRFKKNPLVSLLQPKHMRYNFWEVLDQLTIETEDVFKFLRAFLTAEISTFHKLDVHSGLKPTDVISFFDEVNAQVQHIYKFFNNFNGTLPQVIVYLDEINTSSCMGLFKEIVVDRTIDGKQLPDNVFIIATCNPLRGDSTAVLRNMKNVWHKPSYYVRKVHPTMNYLKWDYGALNDLQELEYVTAKMKMLTEDVSGFKSEKLTYLITQSQTKIREFAERALKRVGCLPQEAKMCARSCVSQRDMQRVFDFYKWLLSTYSQFSRFAATKGQQVEFTTKEQTTNEQQVRAVLVALGLVYYLRLGDKDRKSYSEFLNIQSRDLGNVDFTTAFNEELNWYMERVDLPPGIAKTTALKENVFANIVCCQTHTPLIIIGEPGTSKTLSFNIVANTFKGRASRDEDFRVIKLFKGLQPYFYQCSQHTNSNEIESLFKQAKQRQNIYEMSSVPTYCVVFMDEAGLPEERHESLKVLHYHLDKRELSFVAITNHALDAAKTNRAISLYRPETSTEDLEILATDLLHSEKPITELESDTVKKFCSAFSRLMEEHKFKSFFGLRDFLHFVRFLRKRRGNGVLNEEIVLEALERNFNGHEDFPNVCNYFLNEMGVTYDDVTHQNVLKITNLSLKDLPSSHSQATMETESRPDQLAYTEHGVRYKLIIDGSEDDSAVRYLFACGALDKQKTRMFACSEFIEESHMHINTIAGIIHSVEQGHTIVMFQTDEIHESFYELFNQRFRILDDPKKGLRLFTNISIGAHTKPCKVHPEFQCIVVVKRSELKKTPQPFLNRFEKFLFSHSILFSSLCETAYPNTQIIFKTTFDKVTSLVNLLGCSRSFYGYIPQLQESTIRHDKASVAMTSDQNAINCNVDKLNHETLCSLFLTLLPSSLNHNYQITSEIDIMSFDNDKYLTILSTTLRALQTKAGWNISQLSDYEMKMESKILFDMLLKDTRFSGILKKPEFDFKGAICKALDALHSSKINIRPMDENSCLIVALIVQWLIRYLTKHLMHLLTPEALIINAKHIPNVLIKSYFEFQEHFNLKILINSHLEKLKRNHWKSILCATKVLVYTRQSHLFGFLPSSYPSEGIKEDTIALLKSIVNDDLGLLKVYKVTPDTSEREIEREVQVFMESADQTIFLIIANMQELTLKTINHLRILVEQKENESSNDNKLIVFLLQGQQIFTHCYPALFLSGWDHFYLDSLTTNISLCGLPKPLQNIVDIRQCFHVALGIPNSNSSVILRLEPLLIEAIPVISSRVVVGDFPNMVYNKSMSIIDRQNLLKELLLKDNAHHEEQSLCTAVGEALCFLFTQYWDNLTVTKFLQASAHFTFHHQSTLSITSYIQTRIKALFFEFVVYMLWKINEDCNLDCYYVLNNSAIEALFGNIIKNLFFIVPSLLSLPHVCRALPPPKNKGYRFPFFHMVYCYLEEMLDCSQEILNKKSSESPKSQTSVNSKEKMLFEVMKEKLQEVVDLTEKGDSMMLILSLIIKALKNDELWQRYLGDFIKYKCTSDNETTDSTYLNPLVDAYFDFNHNVKSKEYVSLLAWVHVRSEVHKIDLTQTINQIQRLEPFLFDELNDALSEAAMCLLKKDLGSFVIQKSFHSLNNIFCDQSTSDENEKKLRQWYLTYRDIIQMTSLYDSLHDVEDINLRLLFFKTHMVYILITCSESLTPNSLKFTITFYKDHIAKMSNVCIESFASKCISALSSTNQGRFFINSVVDNILRFMFHTVNLHRTESAICQWFFRAALPGTPDSVPLLEYISPAQYKYYLLHILAKDDQTDSDNVLNVFQSNLLGEMISTVDPEQCANVFISDKPTNSSEMCVLAKMYLLAAYEQICNTTTDMSLLVAITKLETLFKKVEETSPDGARHKLLILEREAFMQRCLYLVAVNLSRTAGLQEMTFAQLFPKINTRLQKEGLEDKRGLVLIMHLWKELKSTEKLIRVIRNLPQDKIYCLKRYKDQLKECHDDANFKFFFLSFFNKESQLTQFYTRICELMKQIHDQKKDSSKLKTMANKCQGEFIEMDFSTDKTFRIQKINAFCMCIWLIAYYEYYQKNVKSERLSKAITEQLEKHFSDKVIRLIISFLNKDLVHDFDTSSHSCTGHIDPIYNFFFSTDTHDQKICNALASVVAATLVCSKQTTHLWYHIFSPDELLGTYVTGFLLDSEIKEGRLYDCGVVLNEQGEYGRPEYLQRAEKGILNLHSLYLLLWCNFGAFCVSLLTQRGAIIKGTVISDYQAVRHYCKSQMNAMWLHMSTNLGLTDEQLSLLIVRSMQRMIQICCENPKSGLLNTSEQRDDYEEMWHKKVFVPSLDEVRTKIDQYSQVLQTNQLLKDLRDLQNVYPFPPTLQDFSHYVQEHCLSNQERRPYNVLVMFVNHYPFLQAGGALLPSLIEFYQWIHTDLSYIITKKQANEMTVDDAVELAAGKYSKELEKYYTKLYERVTESYNHYVETIGYVIRAKDCDDINRENNVLCISGKTPLFHILPKQTTEEEGRDFLFLVIEDIINLHNHFIERTKVLAQSYPSLQKYICNSSLPDLHPAAVNEYSCIVTGQPRSLVQLICKHQSEQGYDLDKIQEDIVVTYIAGKLKIADCRLKLKKTFHYKSDLQNEPVKLEHPTELMLTLLLADNIDDDFKVPISKEDDFLVALKYELLSMDYEKLIEVAQGLKTITEHVKQSLNQNQVQKEEIINDTIGEALPKLVYDQDEAHHDGLIMQSFDHLGMTRLQDSHRTHIAAIPMKKLFPTLELVVEWIKDGIYDFCTLPKAMKRPLRERDKLDIMALQQTYDQTYPDELLDRLKVIVEALLSNQQHFINNIDRIKEKNIFEYLRSDLNILGDEEGKVVKHFPGQVLINNYMELRICLRKLMSKLEEDKSQGEGEESKWFEYVHDLWSEHKLQHLRDISAPLSSDEVNNPTTGLYGFQVVDDMQLQDEENKKEPSVEKHKEVPSQQQPLIQDQAMSVGGDGNLRKIASELTSEDIADYLRDLKLDDYIENFKEIDVDGDMMFDIDYDTLETVLGVDTKKDRVKIKTKFKQWLWKKSGLN